VSDPKILDGTAPSGAWSMSRDLLTAFVGSSRYTDVSGAVSSLKDQSGNARNLDQATAGNRPAVTTAGPNSRAAADFASQDTLIGTAMSSFMASNAGYAIVSFIADSIASNGAQSYNNNAVWTDGGGFTGVYLKNAGTPKTAIAFNWDGNDDAASSAVISLGTVYVVEWKHEGGNISLRVNGGAWVDVASGNTSNLGFNLQLGSFTGSSGTSHDGPIFEFATWAAVPVGADAIAANFKAHAGA
jgi:hypothetical protein